MGYNKDWKVHEDFADKNSFFNTNVPDDQAVDNTTYKPSGDFRHALLAKICGHDR